MKLVSSIEKLTEYTIQETNRYIQDEFRIVGKTLQEMKDNMNTADFTKLFQYIVNEIIEKGINDLKLSGKREEVDGYDYIIDDEKIEFKLNGGDSKSSLATGNKTSHFGGKKSNYVWCIKYTFNNNQIDTFSMFLIDTDKTENNVWKSSSGRKDSFSTLKLTVDEIDCVISQIGVIKEAKKWLQFHNLPVAVI